VKVTLSSNVSFLGYSVMLSFFIDSGLLSEERAASICKFSNENVYYYFVNVNDCLRPGVIDLGSKIFVYSIKDDSSAE
jgi:hypothetical protein